MGEPYMHPTLTQSEFLSQFQETANQRRTRIMMFTDAVNSGILSLTRKKKRGGIEPSRFLLELMKLRRR